MRIGLAYPFLVTRVSVTSYESIVTSYQMTDVRVLAESFARIFYRLPVIR
ncbi:MAG: hypothetical protein HPY66_1421 [Firmicutes bacterium]|nr:hypothetical protein [Bacillota bacterium]